MVTKKVILWLYLKKSYTRNSLMNLCDVIDERVLETSIRRSKMSWMSRKTGRPKEQDGHKRRNISVDSYTDSVLQKVDNKSKFIEYSISACMQSRRIRFHNPDITVNNDQNTFMTAAAFVWTPNNSENNVILSISCYFGYRCAGKGFRFRVAINEKTMSAVEELTSIHWTVSNVFTNHDFVEGMRVFPNQSSYTLEFQFKPEGPFDTAYVKDINIYLDVVDGMLALSP